MSKSEKIQQLQQILSKEMNRKEFLQHIGLFMVGVVGITAVINQFSQLSRYQPGKKTASLQSNSNGYGNRPYGR